MTTSMPRIQQEVSDPEVSDPVGEGDSCSPEPRCISLDAVIQSNTSPSCDGRTPRHRPDAHLPCPSPGCPSDSAHRHHYLQQQQQHTKHRPMEMQPPSPHRVGLHNGDADHEHPPSSRATQLCDQRAENLEPHNPHHHHRHNDDDDDAADDGAKPSNERLLGTAFVTFMSFALVQLLFAAVADSEAMVGDSAAMIVDSFSYLVNYLAERRKHGLDEEVGLLERDPLLRNRTKRKVLLQMEIIPPLISVTTLLIITAVVMHKSLFILIQDINGRRRHQDNPNIHLMMIFSSFNLCLDFFNVFVFAKAHRLFGYPTVATHRHPSDQHGEQHPTDNGRVALRQQPQGQIMVHSNTYASAATAPSPFPRSQDIFVGPTNGWRQQRTKPSRTTEFRTTQYQPVHASEQDTDTTPLGGGFSLDAVVHAYQQFSEDDATIVTTDASPAPVETWNAIHGNRPTLDKNHQETTARENDSNQVAAGHGSNRVSPPKMGLTESHQGGGDENDDDSEEGRGHTNLNMCSAYTHVLADTLRSIAVIVAAATAILVENVTPEEADSAAAVVVSLLILLSLIPLVQGLHQSGAELRQIYAEERAERMLRAMNRPTRSGSDDSHEQT